MNEPITAQYHGVCTAWHDKKHQQAQDNSRTTDGPSGAGNTNSALTSSPITPEGGC